MSTAKTAKEWLENCREVLAQIQEGHFGQLDRTPFSEEAASFASLIKLTPKLAADFKDRRFNVTPLENLWGVIADPNFQRLIGQEQGQQVAVRVFNGTLAFVIQALAPPAMSPAPAKKRERKWTPQEAEPIIRAILARPGGENRSLRKLKEETGIPKSTIQRTDAWRTLGADPHRRIIAHSPTAESIGDA